jgi:myo-inositol-1(or 4)-monophosphatase
MTLALNLELLEVAIKAGLEAGKVLNYGLNQDYEISYKGDINNLVTEYDKKAEEIIINMISDKFPNHSFLAEESGATNTKSDNIRWVIDPLDGTVNFAHKLPIFSVSIAAELNGEILCGVIFQPVLNELFTAAKGNGAYLNDKRISVSKNANFDTAFLVTGFPYNVNENPDNCLDDFAKILSKGLPVRRLGSAAIDLAYVACGRFDAFWEVSLNAWDVAAGAILVEEAGGIVTNYKNEKFLVNDNSLIASNGHIHQNIVEILKRK